LRSLTLAGYTWKKVGIPYCGLILLLHTYFPGKRRGDIFRRLLRTKEYFNMLSWRPPSFLRRNFSWAAPVMLMLLWVPLLAACGGSSTPPPNISVSIKDNSFSPHDLQISAGQTVTWMNNGQAVHTVTADDGSFDSGNLNAGESFQYTFTKPGRYPYFCRFHGGAGGIGMAGVIIVGGSSSTGELAGEAQPETRGTSYVPAIVSTILLQHFPSHHIQLHVYLISGKDLTEMCDERYEE
jgi:plastocyanin